MAFAPTQSRVSFKLPIFDSGLNTKYTDVSCPLSATPDSENMLFDEFGAIRTANGYTAVTSLGSSPVDCLGVYEHTSGLQLCAACGGTLYAQTPSGFSTISTSTGVYSSPSPDMDVLNVNSYVVFSDGEMTPQKYDGQNLYQFGIPAPATGAVSISTEVGVLTGDYVYALTYVNNDLAESDYTIIGSFTSALNNNLVLTDVPVAPSSYAVSYKNLYRTTAAASSLFYLVTYMTATDTIYTDGNPDASLVTAAPLDQGLPPKAKYLTYYRGRVWAAGVPTAPYRLYFSEAGQPEKWPSANYIDVEKGDTLPISAIEAWGNSIVIHKNDGKQFGCIYLLYIADSQGSVDTSNWYIFKSPAAFSAVSHKAQAFFKNLMFYINRTGCYAFTGQDLARTTADSDYGRFQTDNLAYDIDPDIKDFNGDSLSGSVAVQFDNKVWISVPKGETSVGVPATQNNKVYVYDFIRLDSSKLGVWSRIDYPGISDFQVCNGILYGGTYDGSIHQLHIGNNFNGASIDPYFYSAPISGSPEHRDNTKVFRILYITHDLPGNYTLNIEWYVDFSDFPTGTTTINFGSYGSFWGNFNWGTGTWGSTHSRRSRIILSNAVGKIIQFKFYMTGIDHTFKIKELELDYNLRSKRG